MATHHLVTPDGTVILPGTMLHAREGVHAGTHWRLERIVRAGTEHVLRCSRYVHRVGRVFEHLHPSTFGLSVIAISRWFQFTRQDLVAFWHRVRDGLFAGALALVPLALYEAFHGSEHARVWLRMFLR